MDEGPGAREVSASVPFEGSVKGSQKNGLHNNHTRVPLRGFLGFRV